MSRGPGKTTRAILRSQKTGKVIVCSNQEEAERVARHALRLGASIPKPVSWGNLSHYLKKRKDERRNTDLNILNQSPN